MGNSASSALPYTIGEQTHPPFRNPYTAGYAIHKGSRNSDKTEVTVFKASKPELVKTPLDKYGPKDPSYTQILPALQHFYRSKTILHPNVLKVHALLDTDYPNQESPISATAINAGNLSSLEASATTGELIIVTEECTPLEDWISSLDSSNAEQNANMLAYGIHSILNALTFLHQTAKLAHGALSPHSIYVTRCGDFKLFTYTLITPVGIEDGGGGPTPHFRQFESYLCPPTYRSPERKETRWDVIQNHAVHTMDSYSLGVLLEYLYSHSPTFGYTGQVPEKLKKAVARLQTNNVKMRPRVHPLLKCPVFAENEYVQLNDEVDTLHLKGVEEKIMFLQKLPGLMNDGGVLKGRGICVYKILPILVTCVGQVTRKGGPDGSGQGSGGGAGGILQDVDRRLMTAIVPPLFQIADKHLRDDQAEFKKIITPIIELLFTVNDRGIRGALLSRTSLFATQLDDPALNKSVFEPMCSGFTDSSGPLRELTLKSSICLVPHLTPANLEKLTRYLVRLQADPDASIRTNTVIFIGKIAPNLSEISRSKLVLPAFTRAMKDNFNPCRLAALRAVLSCKEYFDSKSVAERVLPCVVPHLVDAANDVREEAFTVVDEFMRFLREESRRKSLVDEGGNAANLMGDATAAHQQQSGMPGSANGPAPSSGGSYLSSLSSWMTTQAKNTEEGAGGGNIGQMPAAAPVSAPAPAPAPANQPAFSSLTLSDALNTTPSGTGGGGGGDDGGWSDDDFGADDTDGAPKDILDEFTKSTNPSSVLSTPSWAANDDDEAFFSSFEKKTTISSRSSGGKLVMPSNKKKVKPSVTKLSGGDDVTDGWDDF